MNRGFTIVELLVSVAIFVVLTTLVVAKYGNFNQSTLFTNTAYDIALAIREAQSYGLSVRSASTGSGTTFNVPYGINFNMTNVGNVCGSGGPTANDKLLVFFADLDSDKACTTSDGAVNAYTISRGAFISSMCAGSDSGSCNAVTNMVISYQRPNPEAIICGSNGGAMGCNNQYAKVTIQAIDASTRSIVIRQNGQISVERQ